jgi:HK97 family phage major capsid protein
MELDKIMSLTGSECEVRLSEIKAEMNADGANIEALSAEVDAIQKRMDMLAAEEAERRSLADKVAAGLGNSSVVESRKEDNTMAGVEVRNSEAYVKAFANYIKSGDDSECRALLTENVTGGTVAVPDVVYDVVKTAWEKEGIMARVRKAEIKGNLKVGFEISGTDAVVHTEGSGEVDEEKLTMGIVTLVPVSIKKWISISDEVYDLTGESFLRYIYDELTHKIAKACADALIADIVAAPTTSTATAAAVGELTVSALTQGLVASAVGLLSDEAVDPCVVINKGTWASMKAVQYAGSYAVDIFEGLDVEFNNSIKSFDAASTGDTIMIVGDFNEGALANYPNGEEITIKFDDKTAMTEDLIRILGKRFVGLGIVAPGAFVRVVKG